MDQNPIAVRRSDRSRPSFLMAAFFRIATSAVLLTLLLSPFAEELDHKSLAFHMMPEHAGFAIAGGLISSGIEKLVIAGIRVSRTRQNGGPLAALAGIYSAFLRWHNRINPNGIPTFVATAAILAYWHLPAPFNGATQDETAHALMHFTYSVAGSLAYLGSKMISKPKSVILLIVLGKAMGVFGFWMTLLPSPTYLEYPLQQHAEAGFYMMIGMLAHDLAGVPYLILVLFRRSITPALESSERKNPTQGPGMTPESTQVHRPDHKAFWLEGVTATSFEFSRLRAKASLLGLLIRNRWIRS